MEKALFEFMLSTGCRIGELFRRNSGDDINKITSRTVGKGTEDIKLDELLRENFDLKENVLEAWERIWFPEMNNKGNHIKEIPKDFLH